MSKKMTYTVLWMAIAILIHLIPVSVFAADDNGEGKCAVIRIPVSCVGLDTSERFQFTISPETMEYQTLESDVLILKDGENGVFLIQYSYPGTYHYTVQQEQGSDPETEYDATVYSVDVYVTEDEDGKMSAEAVAYVKLGNEKKDTLLFENKRSRTDIPHDEKTDQPDGVKTGDTSRVGWFLCMSISSGMVIIIAASRKRRNVNL